MTALISATTHWSKNTVYINADRIKSGEFKLMRLHKGMPSECTWINTGPHPHRHAYVAETPQELEKRLDAPDITLPVIIQVNNRFHEAGFGIESSSIVYVEAPCKNPAGEDRPTFIHTCVDNRTGDFPSQPVTELSGSALAP